LTFFKSRLSESREDNDVDDAECVGVSTGETDTELAEEEVTESVVIVLLIAL